MPNLSIKNVPEPLAEALRQRAERNHRSLQGELMAILEQATSDAGDSRKVGADPGGSGLYGLPAKSVAQIAAEHRARYGSPVTDAPLAVDIIRAERDAR